MEAGKPHLGYLVCLAMPNGAFQGGVLITDSLGLPVEFRHTEAIMPSRLQRVLYGRVLQTYMYNQVVVGALLSAVESPPLLYIVGDDSYLPGADGFNIPAVSISQARNVPSKQLGSRHDLSAAEYVLELGAGNGPIKVRLNRSTGGSDTKLRDSTAKLLADASETMEILEPLTRVEEAVRLLWDEEQREIEQQQERLAA